MGVTANPRTILDHEYTYHICYTSGTFTPYFTGTVEVLVVGGGGGGGMDMGGGGGGGGVVSNTSYSVTSGTGITVTVGAGGLGAPSGGPPNNNYYHQFTLSATSGSNSVFGTITGQGGGYGGSSYFGYTPNYGYGSSGGCGGGASGYSDGNTGRNGSGNQGYAGGGSLGQYYSGGGGGMGAVGQQNPPHGGAGIQNSILGYPLYWGGGGGGAAYSGGVGGNGGAGGGGGGASGGLGSTQGIFPGRNAGAGGGSDWVNTYGGSGGRYTGGGGGGGMHYNRNNGGGDGGSGIVIIRHLTSAGTSSFTGGLSTGLSPIVFHIDPSNPKCNSVEMLMVAGGGGGGVDMGGGGGGGGVILTKNFPLLPYTAYTVTIGAGGAGATGYGSNPNAGSNGGDTIVGEVVAKGGGGGGSGHYHPVPYQGKQGQVGGSSGGDSPLWGRQWRGQGETRTLGDYMGTPQGYGGGASGYYGDGTYTAGGGGGADQPGWGGRGSWRAGNGGQGRYVNTDTRVGFAYYYGGGGGGAHHENTGGNGGVGGGGGGSGWSGGTPGTGGIGRNAGGNGINNTTASVGGAGGTNTGGGGGGGGHQSTGGAGGSGIVMIRYRSGPTSPKATGGNSNWNDSGTWYGHYFTSSGTFTTTDWTGLGDISPNKFYTEIYGSGRVAGPPAYYTFGNTSSDYIAAYSIPDGILNSSSWTISAWVWFTTTNKGTDNAIASHGNSSTNNGLHVGERSGYPYFGFYANDLSGNTLLSTGEWHHMVFAFNKSTGAKTIYVNGKYDNSHTAAVYTGTGSNFEIGRYTWSTGANLNGRIGAFQIFNKALTISEAVHLFNSLRTRFGK